MAKISELSDGGSLLPTDYLLAVRSGANVKVQADTINVDQIDLGDDERIRLGASQDLQIYHDSATSTNKIIGSFDVTGGITTTSSVGIGTTSPDNLLHLHGSPIIRMTTATTGETATDGLIFGSNLDGSSFLWTYENEHLYFGTNNTERVRITEAGNVGIGTTSPGSLFTGANKLVIGDGSGENGMTIYSGTATDGNIYFADGTTGADAYRGYLEYSHSSNYFRIGVDGSEAMRIDSSGRVGIGTTSPSAKIHSFVGASATTGVLASNANDAASTGVLIHAQSLRGDTSAYTLFQASNSVGTKMIVRGDGNVGIGTASPLSLLHIEGADDVVARIKSTGADSLSRLILQNDGRTWAIDNDGANSDALTFYDATAVAERMRIDSSGRVGIGTTSPPEGFAIGATSSVAGFSIGSGDTQVFLRYNNYFSGTSQVSDATKGTASISLGRGSDGVITFNTAAAGEGVPAEKMRIDSSGNLLVGTTNVNPSQNAVEGIALSAGSYGGYFSAARSSGVVAQLARLSDGDILNFRNSTGSVGSIGTTSGSMYIEGDPAASKVGLTFFGSSIEPRDAGAAADATVDLGASGTRFKDLYLSSGVYLGGTGAQNKLDDYEEGTWTPVYSPQTGTFATMTMNVSSAKYTKVGRYVYVQASIVTDNVDITGASGGLRLSGLPFQADGFASLIISYAQNFGGDFPLYGYIESSTTYSNLRYRTSVNGADSAMLVSDLTTGAVSSQNYIIISGVYTVA